MKNIAQPSSLLKIYQSPIGKKLITGITGLGLALFVTLHMVGNLLMFVGHDVYNAYAHFLENLGPLFWLVEVALIGVVVTHAIAGLQIFVGKLRSRPDSYVVYASRGEGSLQSLSSRTMIVTGTGLGIFLIVHLLNFKFGHYYITQLHDLEVRDLARLVIEKFQQPVYALGYSGIMLLLGFHLRHGIWSALQSLGVLHQAVRLTVYGLSLVIAIAITLGFVVLPLAIYWGLLT